MNQNFRVEENHIRLLKGMKLSWNDLCFGAPTVNPKRPYGSSLVIDDMAKILSIGELDENGELQLIDDQERELLNLHKEMEKVIEILLYNCSITPGVYVNKGNSNEWLLSEEKP